MGFFVTHAGLSRGDASYGYSPFGEVITSSGTLASDNPFRFSTKYFDPETGLGYWGYRWYDAGKGRWLGRDRIEENGGENLYGYCGNDGIGVVDALGLWGCTRAPEKVRPGCKVTLFIGHNKDVIKSVEKLGAPNDLLSEYVGGIACRGQPGDYDMTESLKRRKYPVIPNTPQQMTFVSRIPNPNDKSLTWSQQLQTDIRDKRQYRTSVLGDDTIGLGFGTPRHLTPQESTRWENGEYRGYQQYRMFLDGFFREARASAKELCLACKDCRTTRAVVQFLKQNIITKKNVYQDMKEEFGKDYFKEANEDFSDWWNNRIVWQFDCAKVRKEAGQVPGPSESLTHDVQVGGQ